LVSGEAFLPVQTLEQPMAEQLHDGGGIEGGERQELSVGSENAVGNQGMGIGSKLAP